MASAYHDHLTPDQLDKMDYKNPTSFHILTDMVEVLVRDTGALYSKAITKDAQKAIAKKLVSTGYRYLAIKSGLNRIVETSQHFPSYAEIVTSVRLFMPQDSFKDNGDLAFEKEKERFNKLHSEMLALLGEDGIQKYLKWWLKHVLDLPLSEDTQKFLKCALFDWYDAGMSNDFQKIQAVGKAKVEKARERITH